MATATLNSPVLRDPLSDELYEVVEGVVVEKDVSALAIWIANELSLHLAPFARREQLGLFVTEMVFILDVATNRRRRPDLAFVGSAKWTVGRPPPATGDWAIVPDLAVEVASPSNSFLELIRKMDEYFAHGVTEVWIIVPEQRIVCVYRSPRESIVLRAADSLSTPLLPGWSATVGDLLPVIPDAAPQNGAGTP